MNIGAVWDSLVAAICRPPRDTYQLGELLGGRRGYTKLGGRTIVRDDLVLVNKRGHKLQCSHYKPADTTAEHGRPIVVYCHCNSGSRRDAEEAFYALIPQDVTVFCLDFAGSGLSDGEYVTLGAHEVDDLEAVVQHLRASFPESTIGLWGRSMGAVTALMYSQRDPSIAGVVMDSPFARLTELMVELVDEQKLPIPKPFMRVALGMMRRSVRKRADFNIDDVAPLNHVGQCFIPALFGHATEDTFVHKSHSQRLHDAYAGDKDLVTFKGDHNSVRPQEFYSSTVIFLLRALQWEHHGLTSPKPPQPLKPAILAELQAEAGSERGSMSRTSSSRDEKEEFSPRQREIAPPWDLAPTRTFTEQQLELIREGLVSYAEAGSMGATSTSNGHSHTHSQAGTDSTARHSRATSVWQDSECPCEPPESVERAPWLTPPPDEKAEAPLLPTANGSAGGTEGKGDVPVVWAPARLAKRLFEEEGTCQPKSEASRPEPAQLPGVRAADAKLEESKVARERRPPALTQEERFWQLPSDLPEELPQPPDDADDKDLARAIEASIAEQSRQAQRHSVVATVHAGQEASINSLIPKSLQNLSQEDAEEMMLVEAIKQSLREAAKEGLVDPTPKHSAELPTIPSQSPPPGTPSGKKSRGLFWRKKGTESPRIAASPAKRLGSR